jgi:hypothetical protein
MMATIEKRVADLETSHGIGGGGGGPRCPECGGLPDREEFGPHDTYELVFVEEGEEMPEDEWCPECGAQTQFVIRYADDEE